MATRRKAVTIDETELTVNPKLIWGFAAALVTLTATGVYKVANTERDIEALKAEVTKLTAAKEITVEKLQMFNDRLNYIAQKVEK